MRGIQIIVGAQYIVPLRVWSIQLKTAVGLGIKKIFTQSSSSEIFCSLHEAKYTAFQTL